MAYLEKTVSDYKSLTAAPPATGTSFRVEAPNSDDENVSTKFASTLYSSTDERNFNGTLRCEFTRDRSINRHAGDIYLSSGRTRGGAGLQS